MSVGEEHSLPQMVLLDRRSRAIVGLLSIFLLLVFGSMQHAKPQQVEFRTSIHASFDEFEPIDLTLGGAVLNELSTTPDHTNGEHCFTITHPFHPLCGQTFLLLSQRFAWGEERVFFADPQTQQVRSLPLAWTNLALPDPFRVVAAGNAVLRVI